MIPMDLELFKMLMPIVVLLWALIFFLWSRVEHPLKTAQLDSNADEAFRKLKEVIHREDFTKLEEDDRARRITIKGFLKIVDLILYRCWSKEIIFHVIDDDSSTKLVVTCRPSPLRITTSPRNPNYLSQASLDHLLEEIAVSLKSRGA